MTGDAAARFARDVGDPTTIVLEGFHALKHALRFGAAITLALSEDVAAARALARELAPDIEERLAALLQPAPPGTIAALAGHRVGTSLLALARRPRALLEETLAAPGPIVLLDRPSFQGNVGAVVRVAAAAGAAGVLVQGEVDPWNAAALRGSAGLHFALPVLRTGELPRSPRPLVAVHPERPTVALGELPPDAILAFGAERHGLAPELLERAQHRVAIPMRDGVSSLNLATAVAVVLYAGYTIEALAGGRLARPLATR